MIGCISKFTAKQKEVRKVAMCSSYSKCRASAFGESQREKAMCQSLGKSAAQCRNGCFQVLESCL